MNVRFKTRGNKGGMFKVVSRNSNRNCKGSSHLWDSVEIKSPNSKPVLTFHHFFYEKISALCWAQQAIILNLNKISNCEKMTLSTPIFFTRTLVSLLYKLRVTFKIIKISKINNHNQFFVCGQCGVKHQKKEQEKTKN